jgi:hypothetical protein
MFFTIGPTFSSSQAQRDKTVSGIAIPPRLIDLCCRINHSSTFAAIYGSKILRRLSNLSLCRNGS